MKQFFIFSVLIALFVASCWGVSDDDTSYCIIASTDQLLTDCFQNNSRYILIHPDSPYYVIDKEIIHITYENDVTITSFSSEKTSTLIFGPTGQLVFINDGEGRLTFKDLIITTQFKNQTLLDPLIFIKAYNTSVNSLEYNGFKELEGANGKILSIDSENPEFWNNTIN